MEPTCIEEGQEISEWKAWGMGPPYIMLPGLQVIIGLHLFFVCGIMNFVLIKMRFFELYEIVIGETDAFSLLLNAYLVSPLASLSLSLTLWIYIYIYITRFRCS